MATNRERAFDWLWKIALLVFGFVAIVPTLSSWMKGSTPSVGPIFDVVIVIGVGIVLAAGTGPAARYLSRTMRPVSSEPLAPADMVRDLRALIASAKRVWPLSSPYGESLAQTTLSISNHTNGLLMKPEFANARPFLEQTAGVVQGWRCAGAIEDVVWTYLDAIGESNEDLTREQFLDALRTVREVGLAGSAVARAFAQDLNGAHLDDLPKHYRDAWKKFANSANAFSLAIRSLGDKSKGLFGDETAYYVPQIDELGS